MTALIDNVIIRRKPHPTPMKLKVVDGAITIFKGAHLAYEGGNIGYVQLAADELLSEYAGIALESKTLTAALNTSDGTFEIEVLPRGNSELIEMIVTSTITIANEGDPVYMDDDGAVDIASGIAFSTTLGQVGIIRQFVSSNKAWVQMTQHESL